MTISKLVILIIIVVTAASQSSCKKYLTAKPDKALAVPSTLQDLQALLDYWLRVNNQDPGSAVQSVDDFYLTDADFNNLNKDTYKKLYTWSSDALFPTFPNDWSYQYDIINIANTVLDNIDKIEKTPANERQWNDIKGQALLNRARSFQWVTWQWANAYDKNEAAKDLGIPLRLHSDFNVPSVRPSLQNTYDRIVTDYKESLSLLPEASITVLRPSKQAACALLARTYLSMGDYVNSKLYADSCLGLDAALLDYNSLNAAASYPVQPLNDEIIMENRIPAPSMFSGTKAKIDSILYNSYSNDDLRKTVFFKYAGGAYNFKGSYEGGSALFSGIATDEVFLMKAECLAREGNTADAMEALNNLLIKRWKENTFHPLTAADANDALAIILQERRKELLMRGLRWMDLKRLNREGLGIVMKRVIAGQPYTLNPNAARYAFPIPDDIIDLTGMQQNPE